MSPDVNVKAVTSIVPLDEMIFLIIASLIDPLGEKSTSVFAHIVLGASSTVRKGDWKLLYYHDNGRFELFNVIKDIGEQHNLIDSHPQKAKELAAVLSDYLKKVNAQMPVHKKTGKKVALPIDALNIK